MLLMFSLYSLLKHRDPKGKQAAVFLFMILSSLKCCPQLEGTRKKKKKKLYLVELGAVGYRLALSLLSQG